MTESRWYKHRMESVRDILITCVGTNFGPDPETKLDEIRESRLQTGRKICADARIGPADTVLDLGSGCGFVTRAACEVAGEVHCVDISADFLNFARDELSGFDNVKFHLIGYGKIPPIADGAITFAYSTAVFIHFLYYDFLFYLLELNRVLRAGGKLYVEILDADVLRLDEMKAIRKHVGDYWRYRSQFRLLQPFSLTAFGQLAGQLGFEILSVERSFNIAGVTLQKTGQAQVPEWLSALVAP